VFKLESTIHHSVQTSITHTGGSQSALGLILGILSNATDLYKSLSTGSNWHSPGGGGCVSSCWNCNGDHGIHKYKLPKDQACIGANKNKWEEEKKKTSGSGSHSSGGKQYERSMFGDGGGSQKPSRSGVEKFNNMWYMYCGKGCEWNCTHTSAFMPLSLQIHLPFPLPCLSHILIIKGLQENNAKQDLFHLLLLLFLQLISPLFPAAMTCLS
jgi:hypothetical protein